MELVSNCRIPLSLLCLGTFLSFVSFLVVQKDFNIDRKLSKIESASNNQPKDDRNDLPMNSCFCLLKGKVDECSCDIISIDHFNNEKLHSSLTRLLHRPFFRFFSYNPNRPCPFWSGSGDKCFSPNCAVKPCKENEVPEGLRTKSDSKELHECSNEGTEHLQKVETFISEENEKIAEEMSVENGVLNQDFCDSESDKCEGCIFVDLTLNPERFTGYSGGSAEKIWKSIYNENCFLPRKKNPMKKFPSFDDLCMEEKAFFRILSGLHTSITVHLCANHLSSKNKRSNPFESVSSQDYEPNVEEFQRRFHPSTTYNQGPKWLKNLYFLYLFELRALRKLAENLGQEIVFTGNQLEDSETRRDLEGILKEIKDFPGSLQFNESGLFKDLEIKEQFRQRFQNISRIMDCVSCDKCKLWGKLQVSGIGTALKILFSEPPRARVSSKSSLNLSRNEIVSLFNAFGRISTSIKELQTFRKLLDKD